jgi:hypothetical protein
MPSALSTSLRRVSASGRRGTCAIKIDKGANPLEICDTVFSAGVGCSEDKCYHETVGHLRVLTDLGGSEMAEILPRGVNQTFPLAHTDPLAHVQTISVPTEQDILSHPIYSQVLTEKINEALANIPPAQQTPALVGSIRANVLNGIISNIGSIIKFALDDITVVAGQTLTFQSSWSQVTAGDVRIASGGVIRVSVSNPALPAFFILNCTSLGSM